MDKDISGTTDTSLSPGADDIKPSSPDCSLTTPILHPHGLTGYDLTDEDTNNEGQGSRKRSNSGDIQVLSHITLTVELPRIQYT